MTTLGGIDWCIVGVGIACCGWQCNRCLKFGSHDSKGWPQAEPQELKDLMYYAQLNLAAYAESVETMDERINWVVTENVLNFVGEAENRRAPPYFLYINHEKKDIALIFRGLNMASKRDFAMLMRKKRKAYKDGYVHYGMFKAAHWALRQEVLILKKHCTAHPDYTLSIVGHSLGAGIASLLCVILHDKPMKVGIEPKDKDRIRAICFAPPRVISRNHVATYGHAIRAVVLQDDFFPRVETSVVQHIFLGFTGVWLAGVLFRACLSDFFVSSKRRLKDPEKLYPPGKLYHVVYKRAWHCGMVSPRVVTDSPTGGRFQKLILSLTATSDHHIRKYNKFLCRSIEGLGFDAPDETQLAAPVAQQLSRTASVDREGMSVSEDGNIRELCGKLRPKKSFEITLEGTSDGVESYAEETVSIGSEEGDEEQSPRYNGTDLVERTGTTERLEEVDWNGGGEWGNRQRSGTGESDRQGVSERNETTGKDVPGGPHMREQQGKESELERTATALGFRQRACRPLDTVRTGSGAISRSKPPRHRPPSSRLPRLQSDPSRLAPAGSAQAGAADRRESTGGLVRTRSEGLARRGVKGFPCEPSRTSTERAAGERKALGLKRATDWVDSPESSTGRGLRSGEATESGTGGSLRSGIATESSTGESSGWEEGTESENGDQSPGPSFWKRWLYWRGDESKTGVVGGERCGLWERVGGDRTATEGGAASLGGQPQWERSLRPSRGQRTNLSEGRLEMMSTQVL